MLSTLLVNNATDAHVPNETSRREAIVRANTDAAAGVSDTTAFDSSLGSSTMAGAGRPMGAAGSPGTGVGRAGVREGVRGVFHHQRLFITRGATEP